MAERQRRCPERSPTFGSRCELRLGHTGMHQRTFKDRVLLWPNKNDPLDKMLGGMFK